MMNNNGMNNFMNNMANMMEQFKQMSEMMTMMNTMFGAFNATETPAEAEPEVKQVIPAKKLTLDDLDDLELEEETECGSVELGLWQDVSKDGKPYTWFGWADSITGKQKFPGKMLYYVNDFYLKRDYDAYHPGKTTRYKFRNGGLRAAVSQYTVRYKIDARDREAFEKYMVEREAAKRVNNKEDYKSWIELSK